MSDLADTLHTDNHLLWVTIGVAIAMVFTLEAVQTAVEGAWPHQRHPSAMLPHERSAQSGWGVVALAIIVGGLLLITNLGILLWQELDYSDNQVLASILLGISWILFLGVSTDRLGIRSYLTSIGMVLPVAVLVMLLIANVILALSLIDIWPGMDEVRDALPLLLVDLR